MSESRHGWRTALHARRYTFLLAVLVTFVLIAAVLGEFRASAHVGFDLAVLAVLVMAVVAAGERTLGAPGVLVLAASIAVVDIGLNTSGRSWARWIAVVLVLLFLLAATLILLSDVLGNKRLRLGERIRGAICVYFLVGMLWALSYAVLATLNPAAFASLSAEEGRVSLELLYYSFITLTTVGYGDIAPVTPLARTLSWLQAFTGQMYVAITIARLVSLPNEGDSPDTTR